MAGRNKGGGTPDPVDVHVGVKVRVRRKEIGMSQERLADACGVTFQQIQKYENGNNRISASRIVQIARALQVEPAWIFEGLDFPKTQEGYRASVWDIALKALAANPGSLDLARNLVALDPAALEVVASLAALLASRPAGRARRAA